MKSAVQQLKNKMTLCELILNPLFVLTCPLSLSLFSFLLSDCQDHLYKQLEKNRLLTNELRVALNEA